MGGGQRVRELRESGARTAPALGTRRGSPMFGPPSLPPLGSATTPKGASGSVVPGVLDHAARQPLMSWRMAHA
jgi:hypothetical protein